MAVTERKTRYHNSCRILGSEFAFVCVTLKLSVQSVLSGAVLHDVFTSFLMLIDRNSFEHIVKD
jgi:hypothetical protein